MSRNHRDESKVKFTTPTATLVEKLPPYDLQAERGLVGSIMLSPEQFDNVTHIVDEDDFFEDANSILFRHMKELINSGGGLDITTLRSSLAEAKELDQVGGSENIARLFTEVPVAVNARFYANAVKENSTRRKIIVAARDTLDQAYQPIKSISSEQLLNQAQNRLFEIADSSSGGISVNRIGDLVETHVEKLEALRTGDVETGVGTGLIDLDNYLQFRPREVTVLGARPSQGKALSLDTPIPTESGWSSMEEMKVGDRVFDENGKLCNVIRISEVFLDHECYEVEFCDGTTVVADAGHQWSACDYRSSEPRIVTTEEMLSEGVVVKDNEANWRIATAMPLKIEERSDLVLDPYFFGSWIGGGRLGIGRMAIKDEDASHFIREGDAVGYCLTPVETDFEHSSPTASGRGWQIYSCGHLYREMKSEALLAWKRFIPQKYLRASFDQRLALMQGLMDAKGSVVAENRFEITNEKRPLLGQVRELALSLGLKPTRVKYKPVKLANGRTAERWQVEWGGTLQVFRMQRKIDAIPKRDGWGNAEAEVARSIVSIKKVEAVPVKCIEVDSPSHLYLATESMIPTHNSALAMNITEMVTVAQNVPTMFFSLEMSNPELLNRFLASRARINLLRLARGHLSLDNMQQIADAACNSRETPLYLVDSVTITVSQIASVARQAHRAGMCEMIVIDYMQLITPDSFRDSREQQVSKISRAIKQLARELKIPILVLAQVGRGAGENARAPKLSELRESGAIEQDADNVMFIHRPSYYRPENDNENSESEKAEIHIVKQRNGPTGVVDVNFEKQYCKFTSIAPERYEEFNQYDGRNEQQSF